MLEIPCLICGAGAVKNAWEPVLDALGGELLGSRMTGDQANFQFAQLVYLLRWYSLSGEFGRDGLETSKATLNSIRKAVAKELSIAQQEGRISARPDLTNILEQFIPDMSGSLIYVSTNWDTTGDEVILQYYSALNPHQKFHLNPVHLHGSTSDPNTLYLPTEMTKEPYRSEEEEQAIGSIHGALMKGLETSTRSILYGISLSPLDAELCTTLIAGWNNPVLQEIIVVNPHHEQVAKRVLAMLRNPERVKVSAFHPERLDEEIVYWKGSDSA